MLRLLVPYLLVLCLFAAGNYPRRLNAQQETAEHLHPTLAADHALDSRSVIVQFEGAPLYARVRGAAKTEALARLGETHARFAADLQHILRGDAAKARMDESPVSFFRVYNGVALRIPARAEAEVRQLPYVRAVHPDRVVRAFSVPASGQAKFYGGRGDPAYTGDGVTIAIVDTGVDYTHPDLGGGLGPGYTVIGGFDFVNGDADPMDNHGHGTHVAGIAAGAAPDSRLLALKVLDRNGFGLDSGVIRAIEFALDPDGDPGTDDGVDVINLSLGRPNDGNAGHPVVEAVERAVAAGVVCVVAAGNDGTDGPASIAVPGTAPSAISVGAYRAAGAVAAFSARGPAGARLSEGRPLVGVKPDLVAPGVAVRSTWLSGAYQRLDGTSMASPHVAGLAARAIQRRPDWSPARIKAQLMQSARDLGAAVWEQGAGLAGEGLPRDFVVAPASIDLGLVRGHDSDWESDITLSIVNLSERTKKYGFQVQADWPAAVRVETSVSSLTLAPGEDGAVLLNVRGAPADIPDRPFPEAYLGSITVSDGDDRVEVPVSFFKMPAAELEFDDPSDLLVIQGRKPAHRFVIPRPAERMTLFVPDDEYDAIAQFDRGRYTVVTEGRRLSDNAPWRFSRARAGHRLSFDIVDREGAPLSPVSYSLALNHPATGLAVRSQAGLPPAEAPGIYVSSLSDRYVLDVKVEAFADNGDYYELPFARLDGVQQNSVFRNEPDELVAFPFSFEGLTSSRPLYYVPWSEGPGVPTKMSVPDSLLSVHPGFVLRPPFTKTFVTGPRPHPSYTWSHFGYAIVTAMSSEASFLEGRETALVRWGPARIEGRKVVYGSVGTGDGVTMEVVDIPEKPLHALGGALAVWTGQLDNSATRVRMLGPEGGGWFRNEGALSLPRRVSWSLSKEDREIWADSLSSRPLVFPSAERASETYTVEPGRYTLVVRDLGRGAEPRRERARVELEFKTDRADPDPPRIRSIHHKTVAGGARVLVLDVTDVCNWCDVEQARRQVRRVGLYTRTAGAEEWVKQDVKHDGEVYSASLGAQPLDAYAGFRVAAEDVYGNRLTYTRNVQPGPGEATFMSLAEQEEVARSSPEINAVYPNPVTDTATLEFVSTSSAPVQIFLYDLLGRRVFEHEEYPTAGVHKVPLDVSRLAGGVYVLHVRAGDRSSLQRIVKVR